MEFWHVDSLTGRLRIMHQRSQVSSRPPANETIQIVIPAWLRLPAAMRTLAF